MVAMIVDSSLEQQLIAQRRGTGADRFDEVWEGIYMMAPMPNTEHQTIVFRLASIFGELVEWQGLGTVMAGVNVSDRETDWYQNYRVPDVAVAMSDGKVRDCGTHWLGGPDFLVEVVSQEDQTREKIPFYAALGTRELLLIERQPWRIELYRLVEEKLVLVSTSEMASTETVKSEILPLLFRLLASEPRPRIEVTHVETDRQWLV